MPREKVTHPVCVRLRPSTFRKLVRRAEEQRDAPSTAARKILEDALEPRPRASHARH